MKLSLLPPILSVQQQGWGCLHCGLRTYPDNLNRIIPAYENLFTAQIRKLTPPFTYVLNGGFMFYSKSGTPFFTVSILFLSLLLSPSLHAQTVTGRVYEDRKSTRLNSSHVTSSYAVFCLKKKTYYYQ